MKMHDQRMIWLCRMRSLQQVRSLVRAVEVATSPLGSALASARPRVNYHLPGHPTRLEHLAGCMGAESVCKICIVHKQDGALIK